MVSPPTLQRWKITWTTQYKLRRENADKCLKGDKYELWVPNALNFFLMAEDDLKFGIRYLQWLLYRAWSFVSHVKRFYKVQAFAIARGAQRHASKHQYDHRPRGRVGRRNEGDAGGGYANKEHLKMVLPLKALEETKCNSMYCNTIVQSHLMLSRFLGSEEFSNLLLFAMLHIDWMQCGVAMSRSQPQSIVGNKHFKSM